ncbi:MAG: hypothetical protein FK733_00735 [Asgard group archaeon]|nr:hypothetical protein [Asgard group archaeon]
MNIILPFIESRVAIEDLKDIEDFDKIAVRLGLNGYAILNTKFSEKSKLKGKSKHSLEHITRYEIVEESVEKVKKILPKVRHQYELISVKTTSAKVAQWIVKDNRVDILNVPLKSIKETITHPLANVATENETFIEIDLSPIIFDQIKNKSIHLRQLNRMLNILIGERTPFVLTCNVKTPYMFRGKRAIKSIAGIIGIPDSIFKENYEKFHARIEMNQKKLSGKMKAPGIWIKKEDSKKKEKKVKESYDPDILNVISKWKTDSLKNKQLERQRYFLFEILTEKDVKITEKVFLDQFWKSFTEFFGVINSSKSGVYVSKYDEVAKIGILRCSHKTIDHVRSTLAFISKIENTKVLIHVLRVSGTMKNLLTIVKKKSGEK